MRCVVFLIWLLCVCVLFFVFFFKQKTAYEMRISDWSSDVCSSDLLRWKGRWFAISAASHAGCDEIVEAAMQWVEARDTTATAPVASAEIELTPAPAKRKRALPKQIGRASCRERVCPYV